MPDPGFMLKDLEEFKGSSRRRWARICLSVVLVTAALIWLLRRVEKPPRRAAAAPDAVTNAAPDAAAAWRPPADVPPEIAGLLAAARAAESRDSLSAARTNYLALLANPAATAVHAFVEQRLGDVNVRLVASPRPMPGKTEYIVRPGDSLQVLARRFGVTTALIVKGNNIHDPDRIQAGDRLLILDKPAFAIVISKGANDLLLTMNGLFFKRYRVGTGQFGRTPAGTFRIAGKIENPPWWHPTGRVIPFGDPENILGTRWMGLVATGGTPPVKGYGIHGTWEEETVGRQSSAGCVRMRNADVEELFLLVPEGTPVRIVD